MGIALGVLGARFIFVGSWLSLIPWGIAGSALGARVRRARSAAVVGALYGFVLSMAFMVAGYSGSASIVVRLPAFAIVSLIGALGGLATAILGALITR
jgi:hypothetical protein